MTSQPTMEIREIRLSELHPASYNPRKKLKKGDKEYEKIKQSLLKFGYVDPIIVNKDLTVIGGHQRLTVLKDLDYETAKCVIVDLSKEDEKALNIALNKITGQWDDQLLADLLLDLQESDFNLDLTGFEPPEIDDILSNVHDKDLSDDDFDVEEELKKPTFSKRGDIWQLGKHRLMCGDSTSITDVEKLMDGQKADLLFTDPPYGVSYEKKTKEVLKSKSYTKIQNDDLTLDQFQDFLYDVFTNAFSCLKDTASYYVFSCQGGDQEMMMMMMRQAGIPCRHQIIWVKDAPVFSMGRLDYDYKHEPILYGWVKKHDFQRKGEQDKSVWEYKRTANKLHPTMKPVELIANALLNSTKKEENVLDLFGGSGSTLIACEQLNRKCFMMELDEHYCDVIIQRWENLTGKKAERIENENN